MRLGGGLCSCYRMLRCYIALAYWALVWFACSMVILGCRSGLDIAVWCNRIAVISGRPVRWISGAHMSGEVELHYTSPV